MKTHFVGHVLNRESELPEYYKSIKVAYKLLRKLSHIHQNVFEDPLILIKSQESAFTQVASW